MTIDVFVYSTLSAIDAGIPVYQVFLPSDATAPAIVFTEDSEESPHWTFDQDQSDLTDSEFQIDCWGSTPESASETAALVHAALRNYKGGSDGVTVILTSHLGSFGPQFEEAADKYRKSLRYQFRHYPAGD